MVVARESLSGGGMVVQELAVGYLVEVGAQEGVELHGVHLPQERSVQFVVVRCCCLALRGGGEAGLESLRRGALHEQLASSMAVAAAASTVVLMAVVGVPVWGRLGVLDRVVRNMAVLVQEVVLRLVQVLPVMHSKVLEVQPAPSRHDAHVQ